MHGDAVLHRQRLAPATNNGHQFAWQDLLIVLAWGVAGALFALRRFSWSPSRA